MLCLSRRRTTPPGNASARWQPDCPASTSGLPTFAADAGVECGPLTDAQRHDMRAEIDALVARAYNLTADELRFIFTDFTENAVSPAYRRLVMEKFEAEAAKWLADAGGSAPDMAYIPRRRSEPAR